MESISCLLSFGNNLDVKEAKSLSKFISGCILGEKKLHEEEDVHVS